MSIYLSLFDIKLAALDVFQALLNRGIKYRYGRTDVRRYWMHLRKHFGIVREKKSSFQFTCNIMEKRHRLIFNELSKAVFKIFYLLFAAYPDLTLWLCQTICILPFPWRFQRKKFDTIRSALGAFTKTCQKFMTILSKFDLFFTKSYPNHCILLYFRVDG